MGEFGTMLGSFLRKAGRHMASRKRNHRLRWNSKKANHGRKCSKGKIKGWTARNYPHL